MVPCPDILPGNGKVVHCRMPDQPSGADPQEMFHCLRRIVCLLQFLLKGRNRVLQKSLMDPLVLPHSLIADGDHIGFLICKMFYGMFFYKFNSFSARLPAVIPSPFLLCKLEKPVDILEKFLMLFINGFYSDIILFFPFKLSTHKTSFCCPHLRAVSPSWAVAPF